VNDLDALPCRSLTQSRQNHFRWGFRIRPELECLQPPIIMQHDEVRERATRVHPDARNPWLA
jgi:hypothetical protein